MPRVVLGTRDTEIIQTSSRSSDSSRWGQMWRKRTRTHTHLKKSVANETIQLNSTNSVLTGAKQMARGRGVGQVLLITDTPPPPAKQLASGKITWHMLNASGQKDTEKSWRAIRQTRSYKLFKQIIALTTWGESLFLLFFVVLSASQVSSPVSDPGLPGGRLPARPPESQAGLATLSLLPQTFNDKSSTRW